MILLSEHKVSLSTLDLFCLCPVCPVCPCPYPVRSAIVLIPDFEKATEKYLDLCGTCNTLHRREKTFEVL